MPDLDSFPGDTDDDKLAAALKWQEQAARAEKDEGNLSASQAAYAYLSELEKIKTAKLDRVREYINDYDNWHAASRNLSDERRLVDVEPLVRILDGEQEDQP